MQHFRKVVFVVLVILISFCFVVSCDNRSNYNNGSEVTIIEPSFDTATGEEKELVSAKIQIDTYKIKMIPQWTMTDTGVPIYGSTEGKGENGYVSFSDTQLNNIGYYTQGLWLFGLKAYSDGVLIYEVPEKTVEINGNNHTIPISASEIKYSSSNNACTVKLDEFDIFLVDSFNKYYSEDKEYRITYSISPVTANGSTIIETEIVFDENTSHTNTIATISNLTVSGESGISAGTYVISISYYQKVNGSWKKDGGTSYGFTAIPGATMTIKGSADIDLYPNRYVSVGTGESGIIIDSGVKTEVTVKAYDSSNKEITTTTAGQTISVKAVVKEIIDKNTSNTIRVDNYKWFVDGAEVTDKVNSSVGITLTKPVINLSDGSLLFYSTSAKTYTITYMFLDGTNYNTISGNCYLTVNAATTSTP